MDKTGTLTKGEPEVTDVIVDGMDAREVLGLVAAVERESEHPLAVAVVRYADAPARSAAASKASRASPATVPGHRSRAASFWWATAASWNGRT